MVVRKRALTKARQGGRRPHNQAIPLYQGKGETSNAVDEGYREAINRFFGLYRELQKTNSLTLHCSFSEYRDGVIEIWEQEGSVKSRICRVEEKEDIACYKKAMEILMMHSSWEGGPYDKKAG